MTTPRWLSRPLIDLIHHELITEHGGASAIRLGGEDLIEAALARPQHRYAYDPDSDIPSLAAAYLFGFVKNHGFVDGNKRVGFAVATTFLLLNGIRLTASEPDAFEMVSGVADGRYSEDEVGAWIRVNTEGKR